MSEDRSLGAGGEVIVSNVCYGSLLFALSELDPYDYSINL